MNYEIVFHPEATREYADAYAWYEEKQAGLGERFIVSVDDAIADILAHPSGGRIEKLNIQSQNSKNLSIHHFI